MSPIASKFLADRLDRLHRQTDRMFGWLLIAQWVAATILALVLTPWSYDGGLRSVHFNVWAAVIGGALINSVPLALIYSRPGQAKTRHVVAIAQMMWSAQLIMITGGRIETHFHVFGSLAFIAFYADWRVLMTATIAVAGDHLVRGLTWPDSVYGTANPEWWRFLEHAAWVAFEDVVLFFGCARTLASLRVGAEANAAVEQRVEERTAELEQAMTRYRALVENTAAIPFEYDIVDWRVVYMAPQVADLLDVPPEGLTPEVFANAMHPGDREHVRAGLAAFARGELASGEPIDYRVVSVRGRVSQARLLLSDRAADGRTVRGIVLDVTRQKRLEEDLRRAHKLESVGRLAAGVAHEINTPIQFVSDSVQFAREAIADLVAQNAIHTRDDGDLDYIVDELPRALDRALEGTDRIATIVRSMRAFAQADRADVAPCDLNQAIANTLTIARNEYKYVADLESDLQPLPEVTCSLGDVNQLVLGLVINAARAIKDKVGDTKERGLIRVVTRREGEDVVVSVSDTGLQKTIRDLVLDPFLVDRHGGTLSHDFSSVAGTTFRLRLPIQPPSSLETAA